MKTRDAGRQGIYRRRSSRSQAALHQSSGASGGSWGSGCGRRSAAIGNGGEVSDQDLMTEGNGE